MRKIIYALLLLAFSVAANAQQDYPRDITLNWTNPSEYVDGTLMEPGDLKDIHINCYRQNDTVPMMSVSMPDNGEGMEQGETFIGAIAIPGTYKCEGFAISIDDVWSDASVPAFKKYTGKPKSIVIIVFT